VKFFLLAGNQRLNTFAQAHGPCIVGQGFVINAQAVGKNIRRDGGQIRRELIALRKQLPGLAGIKNCPELVKHGHARGAGINNFAQKLFCSLVCLRVTWTSDQLQTRPCLRGREHGIQWR
jgi:hypothetical protein